MVLLRTTRPHLAAPVPTARFDAPLAVKIGLVPPEYFSVAPLKVPQARLGGVAPSAWRAIPDHCPAAPATVAQLVPTITLPQSEMPSDSSCRQVNFAQPLVASLASM